VKFDTQSGIINVKQFIAELKHIHPLLLQGKRRMARIRALKRVLELKFKGKRTID
jgi:hypothetical protein